MSKSSYTNPREFGKIVGRVRDTFVNGKARPVKYRKQQLRAIRQMLIDGKDELANAMHADMSKSYFESVTYEIDACIYEVENMLAQMDKWLKPVKCSIGLHQPIYLFDSGAVEKVPQGVVLIIAAWNYPIRLSIMPAIGAIAAGNTLVLKLSEICEHTTAALARLIEAYLDPDCFQVVQGGADETTQLLKEKFDHFFYTGNGNVGRIIAKAAAEQLARVTLELGGKCPVIVTKNCSDIQIAVSRLMWGKLTNAGQTCVAPDYMLVERDVYAPVIEAIKLYLHNVYGSDPRSHPDYGRIVSQRHFDRLYNTLKLTNGNIVAGLLTECNSSELYIPPTVVTDVQDSDPLLQEELFGPILPVIVVDDIKDCLKYINSRSNPLALYIFGNSRDVQFIKDNTISGGICVNDVMLHMSTPSLPFGGFGGSGTGSYTGEYSINTFSHLRPILTRSMAFPPAPVDGARSPPYGGPENAYKYSLVKKGMYPTPRKAETSLFMYFLKLIPGWTLLAMAPDFIKALFKASSPMRRISK